MGDKRERMPIPGKIMAELLRECKEHGLTTHECIGFGGFGVVYDGTRDKPYPEDTAQTNRYAIKMSMYKPEEGHTKKFFDREVEIQQMLAHSNIVRIYEVIVK